MNGDEGSVEDDRYRGERGLTASIARCFAWITGGHDLESMCAGVHGTVDNVRMSCSL
jgi:hypothetical protein